ncbi:hypothetical protein PENSPDRAFT_758939 [Peniophora sp. CONT]|nr:hypothetical protein PENSPDRAFT_758939 [Peniophora sp. CONT]
MRPPVLLSLNARPRLPEAMSPGLSVSDQQRLRQENEKLRQESEQLRQENEQLRRKDELLRQENDVLRADAAGHEIELGKIRQENDVLRADAAKREVELGNILRIERETFAKQLEEANMEIEATDNLLEYAKDARQIAEDNAKKVQESKIALLDTVDVLPGRLVDVLLKEALRIPSLVGGSVFASFETEYRRVYREEFADDQGILTARLELGMRVERLVNNIMLNITHALDKKLEATERARIEHLRSLTIMYADGWHSTSNWRVACSQATLAQKRKQVRRAVEEMDEDDEDDEDGDGEGREEAARWLEEVWREVAGDGNTGGMVAAETWGSGDRRIAGGFE